MVLWLRTVEGCQGQLLPHLRAAVERLPAQSSGHSQGQCMETGSDMAAHATAVATQAQAFAQTDRPTTRWQGWQRQGQKQSQGQRQPQHGPCQQYAWSSTCAPSIATQQCRSQTGPGAQSRPAGDGGAKNPGFASGGSQQAGQEQPDAGATASYGRIERCGREASDQGPPSANHTPGCGLQGPRASTRRSATLRHPLAALSGTAGGLADNADDSQRRHSSRVPAQREDASAAGERSSRRDVQATGTHGGWHRCSRGPRRQRGDDHRRSPARSWSASLLGGRVEVHTGSCHSNGGKTQGPHHDRGVGRRHGQQDQGSCQGRACTQSSSPTEGRGQGSCRNGGSTLILQFVCAAGVCVTSGAAPSVSPTPSLLGPVGHLLAPFSCQATHRVETEPDYVSPLLAELLGHLRMWDLQFPDILQEYDTRIESDYDHRLHPRTSLFTISGLPAATWTGPPRVS